MTKAEAILYLDSAAEQYAAAYLKRLDYKGEPVAGRALVTLIKTAYVSGFSWGHDVATGAIEL